MKSKLALGIGLLLWAPAVMTAEPSAPTEYEIKAAFLYNFAKFVEWPADAIQKSSGTFVIGILGHDPFGNDLDDLLQGKTIQGMPLVLKRLSGIEEASACNVLFISTSEESELGTILTALKGRPVLTVSDIDEFIHRGGIVGLSVEEKKVKFSINQKVADQAGLKVSSQLLKLAKTVISRLPNAPKFACLISKPIPSVRS